MRRSFFSSGMLSNQGKKLSLIDVLEIMKLKIENISIQIIPLKQNTGFTILRKLEKIAQNFIIMLFFLQLFLILQFN